MKKRDGRMNNLHLDDDKHPVKEISDIADDLARAKQYWKMSEGLEAHINGVLDRMIELENRLKADGS